MSTISSRMAVAVHVLAYLAWRRDEPITSERMASSVNTNPVVVRRIMGSLRNAGLVSVQPGVGGSAQLAREPQDDAEAYADRVEPGPQDDAEAEFVGGPFATAQFHRPALGA